MTNKALLLLLTLTLVACGGGGGGGSSDNGGGSGGGAERTVQSLSARTNLIGEASVSFSLPAGVTGGQIVGQIAENEIQLISIAGPDGVSLIPQNEFAEGTSRQPLLSVFSFPTISSGILSGTYQARYIVTSRQGREQVPDAPIAISVISKNDPDLTRGTVKVNLISVGPVVDDTETADAMDYSLGVMQEIFDRANITLDVQRYGFAGPSILPNPRNGDPFYAAASNAVRHGAVNIFLGTDVNGLTGPNEFRFSISGSTPGSFVPSPRTAAVLSIRQVTGGDGRFDYTGPRGIQLGDNEKRVAAEEMSRMVGRALALQAPVDFNGNNVVGSDRLPDTESCSTLTGCTTNDHPRDNFMFPRLIYYLNNSNKFYSRGRVTQDQINALNRSVFVD